jgi:hypothetical protein
MGDAYSNPMSRHAPRTHLATLLTFRSAVASEGDESTPPRESVNLFMRVIREMRSSICFCRKKVWGGGGVGGEVFHAE